MNITKISVVVCTYNRAKLLPGCLNSLAGQTLDPDDFEVLVVDNNSSDNTLEIADPYLIKNQNFRIITELNQGLSHARNRGWREARGEIIAFIDDDAIATPEWCERILKVFSTVSPVPAAVGGQIYPNYEISPPAWFSDDFEIRTWGETSGFLEPPRACYGFSGSNMAIQRRIFEKFGGFSTLYGIVDGKLRMGEDAEFFYRIYEQEPNFWYEPSIKVFHWVPKRNFMIRYLMIRSFNCGQSLSTMQNRTINMFDFVQCIVAIPINIFRAIRAMPLAVPGIKREFVKFLEQVSFQIGEITVRK